MGEFGAWGFGALHSRVFKQTAIQDLSLRLIMTDELPPSTDVEVYEAIPLETVQEDVTNRPTTGRKRIDSEHLNCAFRWVIALIVLWVIFTVSIAWEMRLLPTLWLRDERIPAISYSN